MARGTIENELVRATHLLLTSTRTIPKSLQQNAIDPGKIEGWHWILYTQLHEDAHRYFGNRLGD